MLFGNLFEARGHAVKSDLFEIVDWDVAPQVEREEKLNELAFLQEMPQAFFDYFVVENRPK